VSSDEVHLWLTLLAEDEECGDRSLKETLPESELIRLAAIGDAVNRRRHLVTHAVRHSILSRYASVLPRELVLRTSDQGRPFVCEPSCCGPRLDFSVAHSRTLFAVLVAKGRVVGVDAEPLTRLAPLVVARHWFSPSELVALTKASDPATRRILFWDHWTLKESYLKARGIGLTVCTREVSFELTERHIDLQLGPKVDDGCTEWNFLQIEAYGHRISLCIEGIRRSDASIRFWASRPLGREVEIFPTIVRGQA